MGFIYQTPETVGGTVLIIERIESQNYVAGSTGWAIAANGDAEFSNLVARGTFVGGDGTGKHIVIDGASGAITLWTGDPTQELPGSLAAISSPGTSMQTELTAPRAPGGSAPFITLVSVDGAPTADSINLFASKVSTSGDLQVNGSTKLGSVGSTINAMRHGNTSGVTNASSQLVIPHGLGVAPSAVLLGPQSHYARIQAVGVANITVEFRNPAGGALVPATNCSTYWLAIA